MDYLGGNGKVGEVVKGASGVNEAIKILEEGGEAIVRPITVDWNNGKAGKWFSVSCLAVGCAADPEGT